MLKATYNGKKFNSFHLNEAIISYSKFFGLAPITITQKGNEIIFKTNDALLNSSFLLMIFLFSTQVYLFTTMGSIVEFFTGYFAVLVDILTCFTTTLVAFIVIIKNNSKTCSLLYKIFSVEKRIARRTRGRTFGVKIVHFVWFYLNILLVIITVVIAETNPFGLPHPSKEAFFFYICYFIPGIYAFQFSGFIFGINLLLKKLMDFLRNCKSFNNSASFKGKLFKKCCFKIMNYFYF